MLDCAKNFRFYFAVVLLAWNFSCTESPLNGKNILNVRKEKSEETINVSSSPLKEQKAWQVATFRGLIMGKATVNELQKVLGKPSVVADLELVDNSKEFAYHYKNQDEIKGDLVVYVDKATKTVISAELRPISMSKEEALNYLGRDYIITKYSFDDCDKLGFDSAPIYENPNGQLEYIEYRDKGIAIALFQNNDKYDNTVQYILYLSKPHGSPFSKCYSNSEVN